MAQHAARPARRLAAHAAGLLLTAVLGAVATSPALAQEGRRIIPPGIAESVDLQYDSVRIEGSVFHLEGDVDLVDSDRGVRLLADTISFDIEELTFEAAGNVSFEQGELLLNGSAMRGDLDEQTLEMTDVVGVAPGPFYIRARRIEQLEPGKFHAEGGIITPCNQTTAIWEFRSGNMTFKPGSYVRMNWPHIRVKSVPIFGFPWVYWPMSDSARQTGFLIPAFGRSSRKGFIFSQTFFWAINRSVDLTMTYDYFSQAGNGFGAELRHHLGESANGYVRAYYFPGKERTKEELDAGKLAFERGFSVRAGHVQLMPGGFSFRAGADYISSSVFARDFRDDVDAFLQRQSTISGELSKTWGASTVSLVGDSRERFDSSVVSTIGRKLPMLRYSLRSSQVVGPIYFSLQSSAARLEKNRVIKNRDDTETVEGGTYQRYDAFPDVSVQMTQIPWLTFKPFFRWRTTYWSHQQEIKTGALDPTPITRNLYQTGIEVVGPSFFRIFETPGSDYSPRLKHILQPRLTYTRSRLLDSEFLLDPLRALDIIRFDEIDSGGNDGQDVVAEITTRLFSKRYPDSQAEERSVWQAVELTFGRQYRLDPLSDALEEAGAPRIRLPWFVRSRITPTQRLSIQGEARFTPSFTPGSYRLTTQANTRAGGLGISWFRGVIDRLNPEDLTQVIVNTSSNTLQAFGSTRVLGGTFDLTARADMDLLRNRLQQIGGSIKWNLQCCSIGFDIRRLDFSTRQETRFGILLNLAQVGSVGFDSYQR